MSLVLNEDQVMLQESARDFCREKAPVTVLRQLRDSQDARGYSDELWQAMVGLGWAGMAIPEAFGGFEFGYSGLGIVLEETGRTLVPTPLISTVLLSATAINLAGTEAQKAELLPKVAGGETVLAFALEEGALHNPSRIAMTAEKSGDGYVLNGSKQFVLDAHVADHFVVVARSSGAADDADGISLFVVDAKTPGISVQRLNMVDSRNVGNVQFDNVKVPAGALLGAEGQGRGALEQTLDIGRIGLAAEMLGGVQEVFERTVEYLQQRTQFGVQIGAFQALQHRAAIMYSEIELCKSLVRKAFAELDRGDDAEDIPALASMCKAKLSEVYELVSNEGVQMHGGIGMTDEFDIGFFLKRARVAQQTLGDAGFHRDRYARLRGF
ncbi:acyl-CoA dehydrogenase family protein [Pseudohongiella spirulinae]|uniref:Acyl-CoA dehydrogenase n=1 Tax=Pseudohongiella spirulinae TaxID=1249552 RepID=A0A0S2KAZ3_9GAMM|nr:acyl-CoA dehydrogenase family protein [Pseudohongiella spirulinae]ALO45501.1 acyl-CoA dehydrogenase [Pseudohongiella spirulinae]